MTVYFGEKWDAPRVDDATQASTPVGEICPYCTEAIEEGDRGLMIPFYLSETDHGVRPVHMECDLRAALGGVAHQEGRCICFGGAAHDSDDEGLTYREEAKRVLEIINERRGVPL